MSNSAGNFQPLRYYLSCEPEKNALISKFVGLAGPPKEEEKPTAYIVILQDKQLGEYGGTKVDHGIAGHSILLGAAEKGLGGCFIGAVNRKGLKEALNLPDRYDILLVITIGKPRESFVFEVAAKDSAQTRGWWDEQGVRHVPKRRLEDIIIID